METRERCPQTHFIQSSSAQTCWLHVPLAPWYPVFPPPVSVNMLRTAMISLIRQLRWWKTHAFRPFALSHTANSFNASVPSLAHSLDVPE